MNCTNCLKLGKTFVSICEYYALTNVARNFSITPNKYTLYFSKKHEWVDVVDDLATVGITHYAQESLGDIVYAQLPEIGASVQQNEECGALESVKAASEIYSPLSGLVVDINNQLEETPELINKFCYKEGWLFKIEMLKPEEVDVLMTKEQYDEYLESDCDKE